MPHPIPSPPPNICATLLFKIALTLLDCCCCTILCFPIYFSIRRACDVMMVAMCYTMTRVRDSPFTSSIPSAAQSGKKLLTKRLLMRLTSSCRLLLQAIMVSTRRTTCWCGATARQSSTRSATLAPCWSTRKVCVFLCFFFFLFVSCF